MLADGRKSCKHNTPLTMAQDIGLITKVFILSALLAIAIRYGAPLLTWPSGTPLVLALVLLPSTVIGLLLIWRGQRVAVSQQPVGKHPNSCDS